MITLSSYPTLQFNNTNSIEGIFAKKVLLLKSFITNDKNTLFVSKRKIALASFAKAIKEKKNGYLIEILFHGFNFSAKRLKLTRQKYYIDTHKSEVFFCDESIANNFKSRVHKRRLIFFSYDHHLLYRLGETIKQFKKPDVYTGKGLFERNDSYVIKQRKKRK
jgi:hypothetical protein